MIAGDQLGKEWSGEERSGREELEVRGVVAQYCVLVRGCEGDRCQFAFCDLGVCEY